MARWESGTRGRLQAAALELFLAQGYEATTVDEIAARAGVTQRTFFRHFVDKEEVLFDEDAAMQAILVEAAGSALGAGTADALAVARASMAALARSFDGGREHHRARWQVLEQVPALQGRQLVKQDRWVRVLVSTLVDAGVAPREAAIAVELAGLGLRLAYAEWLSGARAVRLVTLLARVDADIDRRAAGVG